MDVSIYRLADTPSAMDELAAWFSERWGIPTKIYRQSMLESLSDVAVPQWYFAVEKGRTIGGLGVIENDFHDRPDLTLNVCAVYVEPDCRGRGIAGALLDHVCADMATRGISTLYLLTDHVGFYERYGWEFFCMAQGDGEEKPSRMYVHRYGDGSPLLS